MNPTEVNNTIKSINEANNSEGYTAGIDEWDTCFKGVVPLYLDTLAEFFDLLTNPDEVVRLERMVRRKWDKKTNGND